MHIPVVWFSRVQDLRRPNALHDLIHPLCFQVCMSVQQSHWDLFVAYGTFLRYGSPGFRECSFSKATCGHSLPGSRFLVFSIIGGCDPDPDGASLPSASLSEA